MTEQLEPKIAQLGRQQVERVQELERELGGVFVVAYERPLRPAKLTDEQVAKLQAAEDETGGVYLVAYEQ